MSDDTLKSRLLADPSKRGPILDDCVRTIDDEVGRLLAGLREQGLLDESVGALRARLLPEG